MKADFIREKEREMAGILEPKPLREAAQKLLKEHLNDFIADQRASERDEMYVYTLERRLIKLFAECNWRLVGEVNSDSFIAWRAKQDLAAKTKNDYLADCCNFLNWLERNGRIVSNPLKLVRKVEARGKEVRQRRALTVDELKQLRAVSGSRWVVYLTAANTGLRRAELEQLQKCDVHLYVENPFISARRSTTKNHKDGTQWLNAELAEELKKLVGPGDKGPEPLFERLPSMDEFRVDLAAAGIEYKDARGHVADFHALRHTLQTNMAEADVPLLMQKEIMRHSEIRLTTNVYTHIQHLHLASAVKKLPTFGETKVDAPGNTPKLGKPCLDESTPVLLSKGMESENPQCLVGDCHSESLPVVSSTTGKLVAGLGFEPRTFRL